MELFHFKRRDTVRITLTFTNPDGTPVDLTGATVKFGIRKKNTARSLTNAIDDDTAVLIKTVTSHSDPTGGVTIITLSSTDSKIEPAVYDWEAQVTDANGDVMSTQTDDVTVDPDLIVETT